MALPAFHRFSELPQELRLEIWQWSLPRPRRGFAPPNTGGTKWARECIRKVASNMELSLEWNGPMAFYVNREARAVARQYYIIRPQYLSRVLQALDGSNYIDLECDTLSIGLWDLHDVLSGEQGHQEYSKIFNEDVVKLHSLVIRPEGHCWDSVEEFLDLLMSLLPQVTILRELTVQLGLEAISTEKYWFDNFKAKIEAEQVSAKKWFHGTFFAQLVVNED